MIKLIIADDEELIKKRLIQCIAWEEMGYEVTAEASDGEELLEKIKEYNPDVVLTDIKMPVMDGIEVANAAREMGIKTEFVIISGYDDFVYAQKGIEAGVFSYILKPIDKLKLMEIFKKLATKLNSGVTNSKGVLYKQIFQMELGTEENIYIQSGAVVFTIYKDECPLESISVVDELVNNSLNDVLGDYYVVNRTQKHITIIYECKENYDFEQILGDLFLEINERIKLIGMECVVSLYYSKKIFETKRLKSELSNLYKCEGARFYLGRKRMIAIKDVPFHSKKDSYSFPSDFETRLETVVQNLELGEVKRLFREIPIWDLNEKNVRPICFLFMNMLYRFLSNKSIFNEEIKSIFKDFLSEIEICEFVDTISACVMECIEDVSLSINDSMDNSNENYLINKAVLYIETNLHRDISLKDIAENLEVSYGYISRLLNQSASGGFVTQLKNRRIQRAKYLLLKTNKKIYEIAYETGFKSARYFSEVFKRETGVAPLDYRNSRFNE